MDPSALAIVQPWLNTTLAEVSHRPLVLGVCGAQGSGKSTLADALVRHLTARGIHTATLSLDDLYLTKAERVRLAREVHPLLITRGVPGTHDVALGIELLDAIKAGKPTLLPRFDKAHDDRAPQTDWQPVPPHLQVLIFEGWCVGARPQATSALATPVNSLEREHDADARWRTYVNDALDGPYRALFASIDRLLLLAAPSFDVVARWRGQQEDDLRRRAGPNTTGVMDDAALLRFIQHYERLTQHILADMPTYADLVIHLSPQRDVIDSASRATTPT